MSFKSTICQTKLAKKGEPIGYNRTYLAEKNIKYAIIPVGYADGYDYLLSNRGEVLIHNKPFPVIGKISMDMLTVDITDDESIKNGDEVTLLNSGCLSSENIVSKYHGLSYELLCQIGRRAKRYFRSNGKIIATSPLARREFVSHDFNDSKLNLIIESAISQRLQSKEIASMLYSEILRRFFVDKDRDVHYRKNFRYQIEFSIPKNELAESFYEVKTTLNFSKVLQQEYFFIACANRLEDLQSYFRRRDVEYRWLLDSNFRLSQDFFDVNQVHINNILLDHTSEIKNGCLEIKCTHTNLAALMNREVNFSISTKTYYPNKSHQLATYITEMTQGVEISFIFPEEHFSQVEVASIFSGQNKYPTIVRDSNRIRVSSDEKEWIFPNSGVVFSY
jgi:alanine racemase